MMTHLSSFSRPRRSPIHQESMDQPVVSKVNMLSRMTGGLTLLYKQINEGTTVARTKKYTNRKGHFIAELNFLLGSRYIIISQIETRGETAVMLKAKDYFHQFRPVVIKVVHLMYKFAGLQEVQTLRRLRIVDPCHISHTLPLLNAFIFNEHVCLVFPALDVQPLTKVIAEMSLNEKKTWSAVRKISRHLLTALAFLRTQNIIHADVKPENILVDEERDLDSVTLIDFGNALNNSQREVSMYYEDFELQTLPYRAPEVLFSGLFGIEIDMWSLGCVLYECYAGRVLFSGSNKTDILQQIIAMLGPVPTYLYRRGKCDENLQSVSVSSGQHKSVALQMMSVNPSLRNYQFSSFLSGLLTYDPDHRMTPWEALQHPFMAEEICIPYFLNQFSPETNLTLKQSDYQQKQKISTNILRMYPSTFDLLRVGTSEPPLTKSPYITQIKPSLSMALLKVQEKNVCAFGESSRNAPLTSTHKCKQASADKCKKSPPVKCQHDGSESLGSQTLSNIKTLAVKVGILREHSEMMSLSDSDCSKSFHSFDETYDETSSKNSFNQMGYVEDHPAHANSVSPHHIASTHPCKRGDLLVHTKTNEEETTGWQHAVIKTEILSLHEDAEFRFSVEEKVTSWLQDQMDIGDNQLHSSGNVLKNPNTHFMVDQNSAYDLSDHTTSDIIDSQDHTTSDIIDSPPGSSVTEMCCSERTPYRKKSHHLNKFIVKSPNDMQSPGATKTYSSKTNVHRQANPKRILHNNKVSSGQETGQIRHEKTKKNCPQRKTHFEESKKCWESPRNATQILSSNSACPISREISNPHLKCKGENSKISSSSFKGENVPKEKFQNSHLNSTFIVDENSCFKPINYRFNPLIVQKAVKEKYVRELNGTFTKEEPHTEMQVTAAVKDESRPLKSMTMSPSHSGQCLNPSTSLKCSSFKQNETISLETFVKCERTTSCASYKSQEHLADGGIGRQDILGHCQCKENNFNNKLGMFSCTSFERKHTTMRKHYKNCNDCTSDETTTFGNNNQQKMTLSPRPEVICEVQVSNNGRAAKMHSNKSYCPEISKKNTSCIDVACVREKDSSFESCGACISLSHFSCSGCKQMNSKQADTLNRSMVTNGYDTTLITVNSEASGPVARHAATGIRPLQQLMNQRHHAISQSAAHSSASTSSYELDMSQCPKEIKTVTMSNTKFSPEKFNTNSSKITNCSPKISSPSPFWGNKFEPINNNQSTSHPVNKTESNVKKQNCRSLAPLITGKNNSSHFFIKRKIDLNPRKPRLNCCVQNQHRTKLVRRSLWSTKKLPKTAITNVGETDLSFSIRHFPSLRDGKRLLQGLSPMSVDDTDPYEFKDSTLKPGQNQISKSKPMKNTTKRCHKRRALTNQNPRQLKKRALTNQNHKQRVMSHELDLKTLVARKTEQLKLGINCGDRDNFKLPNIRKDKSDSISPQKQLPLSDNMSESNNRVQVYDSDQSNVKKQEHSHSLKCHQSTKYQGKPKGKNVTAGQKAQKLNSCPFEYEVQKPSTYVSKMKTAKQKSHSQKTYVAISKKQADLESSSGSKKTVSLESRGASILRKSCNADLSYDSMQNTRKICTNIAAIKSNNSSGSLTCDKEDSENCDMDEDVILIT